MGPVELVCLGNLEMTKARKRLHVRTHAHTLASFIPLFIQVKIEVKKNISYFLLLTEGQIYLLYADFCFSLFLSHLNQNNYVY